MGLPLKLKDMMLFNAGNAYQGQVASVTPPKLTRKFEDWRGGGMDGAVKLDMGMEAMDMEWEAGGPLRDTLRQWGAIGVLAVPLRFSQAFQADDTGEYTGIEIFVRGRHEEIDRGESKIGEGGSMKVKTAVAYYREEWNGVVEVEIDLLNGVCIVGGADLLAERRAVIGL